MDYAAPVDDLVHAALKAAGGSAVLERAGKLDAAGFRAILSEAARFAESELAPLNRVGDREGTSRATEGARTPPGWPAAYRRWAEAGWSGVTADEQWGGQGLPILVQAATQDIWNGANAAFALGPLLTASAIELLQVHGDPSLQAAYLPHLVSGRFSASMDMTEPTAGSDIGALTTRAVPDDDGAHRLYGQKIFVSYGDHDLTPNILHLVLARLDGAPAGSKGLSLFLVPKILPDERGGGVNDITLIGIEQKLGLHGSPTCALAFGDGGAGALGWMVGPPGRGLATMFAMMNNARLMVGIQAVGVAERACQQAARYAKERVQGRRPGETAPSPITRHPDIRRTLMAMQTRTMASRAICFACATALDLARLDRSGHQVHAERAGLLTPIAKAFASDMAVLTASDGIQVHGGAGYIEETGAAQHLRDARVFQIYEGANGIQAIDLVTRKLDQPGDPAGRLISDIGAIAQRAKEADDAGLRSTAEPLEASLQDLTRATDAMRHRAANGDEDGRLAGASPYLRLFGLAYGGALLANGALEASGDQRQVWIARARFFADNVMNDTAALAIAATSGADTLNDVSKTVFE